MVDRKKDIGICRDDSSSTLDLRSIDLETVFLERVEGIHRLIDEDIAIREDEDARSASADPITRPPRHEELVRHLKSDHRLASARREREEHTISPFGDRLHHARDSDLLVVSRTLAREEIRLSEEDLFGMIVLTDHSPIELIRRWIALDIPSLAEHEIKLINLSAIGRVDIPESEDLAVLFDLLESLGRMEIVFFRFDDREIDSLILQEIVRKFDFASTADELATVGKSVFADEV